MNILVTGGAGYIGSILVGVLLARGHKVTVLDTFGHGETPLNQFVSSSNFEVYAGDVRNIELVKALVASAGRANAHVDAVIPLAAVVGAPACDRDPMAASTINTGAIDLMCQALPKDIKIIIPITNSGYGVGTKDIECTEDSPLNPISLYARSKVEAENLVMSRGNAIALRLATVFGMSPRMRLDLLVNDFVWRATHDRAITLFEPHFKRNYIHVRDVAAAFVHALDNFDNMKDEVYNVGLSDANLSKAELCEKIRRWVPGFVVSEASVGEDVDKRDYIVSNAKIEATGWKPQFTLDNGIVELIRGYRMMRANRYGNV